VAAEHRTALTVGVVGVALSAVGLAVSIYLTIAHYGTAKVLACPESGLVNCTKVTTSSYSTQFGVPLAVIGIGFFVVMLLMQLRWADDSRIVRLGRVGFATIGAGMALWLIWVELFRLDAICLYCTAVHGLAIALFVVTAIGTALTAPLPALDDE